jgi:hypothetical protein
VNDIRVGPGLNANLTLSPKKRTLSYTGSKTRSTPRVVFGAQSDRAAYRITVSAPGAKPRRTFYFAKKPKFGLLRIAETSKGAQRYRVRIDRYTGSGSETFARSYAIRGRQRAYLYYGALVSPRGVAKIAIAVPGRKNVRVLKLRKIPAAG